MATLAEGLLDSNAAARQAGWAYVAANLEKLVEHGGGPGVAAELIQAFRWSSEEGSARAVGDLPIRTKGEVKQYVTHVAAHVSEQIKFNAALRNANHTIAAQLQ